MRYTLIPLVLMSVIGAGGVASAREVVVVERPAYVRESPRLLIAAPVVAEEVTGAIRVIGVDDGSVTLSDGHRYLIPATIGIRAFNTGEHVRVNWHLWHGERLVTAIRAV